MTKNLREYIEYVVLSSTTRQASLFYVAFAREAALIKDDLLEPIEALLDDSALVDLVREAQARRSPRSRTMGRHAIAPDRLLRSCALKHVKDTQVIRKGKAHKPNEFGRLVRIDEVENGIVRGYAVLDGNPADVNAWVPALEQHQQLFGRAPKGATADRGFFSTENEREA